MITTATASALPLLLLLLSTAAQSLAPAPSEIVGGGVVPVASAPGPSEAVDCMTYLYNLADCLSYVQPGSNLMVPDKPCCGELSELIKTQAICLCEFLNNSTKAVGVEIDVHRALKLQTICKVSGPSVSLCSVVGYPVAGVPTSSPLAPGMSPGGVAPSSETEKGKGGNGDSGIQFSHPISSLVCLAIALFLPISLSS